ncbi:MAG: LCP family protein [Lachnospiraceae bacterium]|nr:LCP family protein [Lachnospiraceae bacterium]
MQTFRSWPTWEKSGMILVGIQWIFSLVAIITTATLGILRPSILVILILLLIVFGLLAFIIQHSKNVHWIGKILSVVLCLTLLAGNIALIRVHTFLDRVSDNQKKVESKDAKVNTDPFIVLISGNDEYGQLAEEGTSDVNMLVCVNPATEQVLLISTPRDFYIEIPGVGDGMRDKLTHAGFYGMEAQLAALEALYEIDINYYVWLNFSSFIEIIDAIGGINVYNEYAFDSWDGYYFPQGELELDGLHALHFARERKALEDGDFGRGRHQQMVISNMIQKLTEVNSLTVYEQLLSAIEKNCTTNMPKNRMMELVQFQRSNSPEWKITSIQAEGEIMAQACYSFAPQVLSVVMPYKESVMNIRGLIRDCFAGLPITAKQMDDSSDYSYFSDPDPVDWNNYYDLEGMENNPLNTEEIDADGNTVKTIHKVDANGNPITLVRVTSKDGTVLSEKYYNADGKRIDENGNLIEEETTTQAETTTEESSEETTEETKEEASEEYSSEEATEEP